MASKRKKIKAASGRAQPRQLQRVPLVSGSKLWARPSGLQRNKDVHKVTEAHKTQGGYVTVRSKSGPKPYKAAKTNISRKRPKKGGPR